MSYAGFDRDLIRRYDVRGPRYTSYPTADCFQDSFTATDYVNAARESNNPPIPRPLSIYVHIPFCHTLCHYCGCNKFVTRHSEKCAPYLDCLLREVRRHAALYDEDRCVAQLHLGGGTPTYFTDRQLATLLDELNDRFHFSEDCQLSIEIDPRTVDYERTLRLAELGFNRLSLGVQDFDPHVQQAVNRIQPYEQVVAVVKAARNTRVQSISFDLIYGLPHQTVRRFDETLALALSLRPDRISVYNYAHLPDRFRSQRLIRAADLPSPDTKLALFNLTIERLIRAGYEYIGMDHFALPDDELAQARADRTLQRNFQGYSTHARCDLIGLGVSAISHVGPNFCQNASEIKHWQSLLEQDEWPIVRGLAMTVDDQIRADIIQSIMCQSELCYADIEQQWDIQFESYFAEQLPSLQPLLQDGLIEARRRGFAITPSGRMLLRNIAMCFDAHLVAEDGQRFSRAI